MNIVPVKVIKNSYLLVAYFKDGQVWVKARKGWSKKNNQFQHIMQRHATYEEALHDARNQKLESMGEWVKCASKYEFDDRLVAYRIALLKK